jgi:DNA-binding transcriptional LysR family regulator
VFNSHNQVSEALLARGVRRTVALQVSHFTSLPTILAETDLIGVVPSRVAKLWASTHRLRNLPIPVPLPSIDVRVHWDQRFHRDRGHSWIRPSVSPATPPGMRVRTGRFSGLTLAGNLGDSQPVEESVWQHKFERHCR